MRPAELKSNFKSELETTQPLTGRDQELNDVHELLTTEEPSVNGHVGACRPRLITLTGSHGIGKSTLAQAVGRRLATLAPPSVTPAPSSASSGCQALEGAALDSTREVGDVAAEGGANQTQGRVYEVVITVECRGCDGTRESLLARIFGAFDLPYRTRQDNGIIKFTLYLVTSHEVRRHISIGL